MRRWAVIAALGLAALLLAVAGAEAGGPGTGGRRVRLEDEPAGPYVVRVVTSPTPPRVESLYLEIRVEDAASGSLVTDATVQARAAYLDGEAPSIEALATHDIAPNPVEYGVHLPVSKAGRWEISVAIDGEAGSGEVRFEERISRPTSLSTILVIGLPLGGLAALVGVFLGLQRQQRRRTETG
jgi:hypothetical protein